ncbi:MAG: hypothetical protein J6B76_08250, partial [Peptococcaceae bacterium]|nr:hypothetical protein [Peptococcaceae bacterium]
TKEVMYLVRKQLYDNPKFSGNIIYIDNYYNLVKTNSSKVIELLNNDVERQALGKQARESVEKLYSVDIVDLWNNIFREVASDKVEDCKKNKESLAIAAKMLLDFTAKGIESREEERIFWKNMQPSNIFDSEYKNRLDEIENMRTWKLIGKYRKFMDDTKIGRVFSKIRDVFLKK